MCEYNCVHNTHINLLPPPFLPVELTTVNNAGLTFNNLLNLPYIFSRTRLGDTDLLACGGDTLPILESGLEELYEIRGRDGVIRHSGPPTPSALRVTFHPRAYSAARCTKRTRPRQSGSGRRWLMRLRVDAK